MRPLSAYAFVLPLLVALSACASNDDAGGGNSTPSPAAEVLKPRNICSNSGAPLFSSAIGERCGAGSNKDLCVVPTSSCSDNTACVWDAASTGNKAYCTIGCTPGAENACPSGYTCEAQGCASAPSAVCVLRGNFSCTTLQDFTNEVTVATNVLFSRNSTLVLSTTTTFSALTVREFRAEKALKTVGTVKGSPYTVTMLGSIGEESFYALDDDATHTRVLHATADRVEEWTTPERITAVARLVAGSQALVFLGASKVYAPSGGTVVAVPGAAAIQNRYKNLEDGTLVGRCVNDTATNATTLCLTNDGVTATVLPLPSGVTLPERDISLVGRSADDFAIIDGLGNVHRRRTGKWVSDALPVAAFGFFARIGDRLFLTQRVDPKTSESRQYVLRGDCWEPTSVKNFADALSGSAYGYYSTRSFCAQPEPR